MCNLRRMPATFREQGAEHAAVIAAIAAGDAASAHAAMAKHLDNVRRRLVSWISLG